MGKEETTEELSQRTKEALDQARSLVESLTGMASTLDQCVARMTAKEKEASDSD